MTDLNTFIRDAAEKKGWKKYFLTLRPVSIGTCPSKGMMDFINYDERMEVNDHIVWAEVYYDRELTDRELENYEMIRG